MGNGEYICTFQICTDSKIRGNMELKVLHEKILYPIAFVYNEQIVFILQTLKMGW